MEISTPLSPAERESPITLGDFSIFRNAIRWGLSRAFFLIVIVNSVRDQIQPLKTNEQPRHPQGSAGFFPSHGHLPTTHVCHPCNSYNPPIVKEDKFEENRLRSLLPSQRLAYASAFLQPSCQQLSAHQRDNEKLTLENG